MHASVSMQRVFNLCRSQRPENSLLHHFLGLESRSPRKCQRSAHSLPYSATEKEGIRTTWIEGKICKFRK